MGDGSPSSFSGGGNLSPYLVGSESLSLRKAADQERTERERKPVVPPPSLSLNYTTIRSTAEREKDRVEEKGLFSTSVPTYLNQEEKKG